MAGISLETLAMFAEILGSGSIITALIFGGLQFRSFRTQQRNTIAINLAQTFYSQDLANALTLLQPIPDGVTDVQLREYGNEYVNAAITVSTSFETMGLLVFQRIAPLELVLDLAGGIITTMNRKLRTWQQNTRDSQNQPSWGEWFEWLGDQAEKHKTSHAPAHIRYRDWVK